MAVTGNFAEAAQIQYSAPAARKTIIMRSNQENDQYKSRNSRIIKTLDEAGDTIIKGESQTALDPQNTLETTLFLDAKLDVENLATEEMKE